MAFRVVVDRDLCDSQALCVSIAPAVFEMDDDDVMQIVKAELEEGDLDRVRSAVNSCPKGALSLIEG